MSIIYISVIIIAILSEGFFSGAEIAIVSLNRIRLRILAEAKNRKALLIHKMLKNPNRLLSTTLVGTNLCVVVASSFCTRLLYDIYGVRSEWITVVVLSPLILIFGEFVPKTVFSQQADRITFHLASVLEFFWKILYPIVWLVSRFVNVLLLIFTDPSIPKKKSPFVTKEEIKYLIKESEAQGEIDSHERSLIYKIFDFGKKKTKDIMRKPKDLVFLKETDSIDALLNKAKETGYSRFPISDEAGKFIGLVNILDVMHEADRTKLLKDYLRPIDYIDEAMDIDNALVFLRSKKQNLAIVKDPQGAAVGFFTMEDLLEELVGEF